MERRSHNRSLVRLDAVVHDRMYRSWEFVIMDFGYDGLRLAWKNKTSMPDSIGINDLLDVKFSITQNPDSEHKKESVGYHLEVKVTRVLDDGLAVTLFNPALDAIANLSKKQHQQGLYDNSTLAHSLDKRSLNILDSVRHCFMNNLSHMTEIFLPIAHDAIFQQAGHSKNNAEQSLYFDAINSLNKSKDSLKQQFLKLMEEYLRSCDLGKKQTKESHQLDELELIDQSEFENWLAVNQLIIHISPHYKQELVEIELRIAKLLGIEVKDIEKNPFSPEIIFNSFSEALHNHFLNNPEV